MAKADSDLFSGIASRTTSIDGKASWEHEQLAKVKFLVFRGHHKGVNSCCFMDNDRMILSGSDDHSVKLWNLKEEESVGSLNGHTNKVTCCCASFDSRRVVSAGWDNKIIVWDTVTGKPLWSGDHDGIVVSCDLSFDGKYLISGNDLENAVRIWDAQSGHLIKLMKYHTNTVTCCRFSPMRYRFCSTSIDKTTHVIDMQNYQDEIMPHGVLRFGGHGNIISTCSFSSDDRRLCTGSWDKNIQIWDVNAGSYRREGPFTFNNAHQGSISSCKFSTDGSILISTSYDQNVTVWDVSFGFKKFSLQGHVDWVNDCDISSDGNTVLSCSRDRTMRAWSIEKSEDIPAVLQNKLSMGLQMLECQKCGKMFSISKVQDPESFKYCVFCRLKEPIRVFLSDDGHLSSPFLSTKESI